MQEDILEQVKRLEAFVQKHGGWEVVLAPEFDLDAVMSELDECGRPCKDLVLSKRKRELRTERDKALLDIASIVSLQWTAKRFAAGVKFDKMIEEKLESANASLLEVYAEILADPKRYDSDLISHLSEANSDPKANTFIEINEPCKPNSDSLFEKYLNDIQRRIKRKWFPPHTYEKDYLKEQVVIVNFTVLKNGRLSGPVNLVRKSSDESMNEAGLKAVKNAASFRPLHQGTSLEIQFVFDYDIFRTDNTNKAIASYKLDET